MQVHDLAVHQLAAGHDVRVVTATPPARHDRTAFEVVDGVPVHRVTWTCRSNCRPPRTGREVARLLAEHRPDAVHVHAGLCRRSPTPPPRR